MSSRIRAITARARAVLAAGWQCSICSGIFDGDPGSGVCAACLATGRT